MTHAPKAGPEAPQIVRRIAQLRDIVGEWKRDGQTIGVVPTMGALHAGHLSLVRAAMARTDRVIVTLFVNPKQFNRQSDLETYPRTEREDAQKLAELRVPILFCPSAPEMYPDGFATRVSVAGISEGLCGAGRPGHFDGVATVVTKLLLATHADLAFFGEKDFQQLMVVRRLVDDLNIPTRIVGCPTVRESDGLALSSRNVKLTPPQRAVAPAMAEALNRTARQLEEGEDAVKALARAERAVREAGYDKVEYLELRAEHDLSPLSHADRPARLLAAAWLGDVRLIDNVPVAPATST